MENTTYDRGYQQSVNWKIKGVKLGLQLDEAKDAHLICYVLFIDGNIVEDLLFCKNITAGEKAEDVLEILVRSYLKVIWLKNVGVCTDRAHSMAAAVGDYRHLFEVNHQMQFGPFALFTERCLCHSI